VIFLNQINIDARDNLPLNGGNPQQVTNSLSECIAALNLKTAQANEILGSYILHLIANLLNHLSVLLDRAYGWEVWQAILELVRTISEQVTTLLPGFWKIAKEYLQGKFQKVRESDALLCPPTQHP
jgi:hypothetical protein